MVNITTLARWFRDAAWAADIALFDDNDSVKNNQFMIGQEMVVVLEAVERRMDAGRPRDLRMPVGALLRLACSGLPGLNSIWLWQKESIKLLATDLHRHLLIDSDSCHIPMSADVCVAKMNALWISCLKLKGRRK